MRPYVFLYNWPNGYSFIWLSGFGLTYHPDYLPVKTENEFVILNRVFFFNFFVRFEIDFVKVSDAAEAREYGIDNLPSVLYFENKIPSLYDEDLVQFFIFVIFQFYNKLTFDILGLINKIIWSKFKQLLTLLKIYTLTYNENKLSQFE